MSDAFWTNRRLSASCVILLAKFCWGVVGSAFVATKERVRDLVKLALKGDRTIAQLAEHFDVHPNQITAWKSQLEGNASDIFGSGGGTPPAPAVDVKSLHAKIGELTLENDFLEGALTKAGLLSAKQ